MNPTSPSFSILSASRLLAPLLSLLAFSSAALAQQGGSPVKIFILAGQSNMLGQGTMMPATTEGTLDYVVANDPGGSYQFLVNGATWKVRDDVWIRDQNGKKGGLTTGYGSSSTTIGPELGFGHFMGDQYENQVLLVKAAWGGKSLEVDFRPPSSGGTTGFYYNEVVRLVNEAIANLGTYFPGYNAAGGYEIAGFCWHQGWNDRVTPAYSSEYEVNMANFIRDIRNDLEVPGLPFVIASSGMDGNPSSYSEVELAQLAMANKQEFVGNVAVVDTRVPWDGLVFWQPKEHSPADQGYHWNRNARTYVNMGLAMGDAMTTLAPGRCPSRLRAAGGPGGVTLTWQNGLETPTSVRVLRNSVEIAASAPASPASFVDATAQPGLFDYEVLFTMPGDPCDPLTVRFDGGITGLEAFRNSGGVGLTWVNNMAYTNIAVRRDGALIAGSLAGTATSYTDGSPPPSGPVTYSVVPANGNAAPTVVQINLEGPPAGNAVIYEPFDYAVGPLNLKSGNSEVGLEGMWNGSPTALVTAGTLSYGTLPVGGAKLSDFTGGQNNFIGFRAIRSSALAGNGLLDGGATLWFSVLMGYDTGGNLTNTTLAFALANSQFTSGNYSYQIANESPQLGSGLGAVLGRSDGSNGHIRAAQFQDPSFGTGFSGIVYGTDIAGSFLLAGKHALVVGKIVWGATPTDFDTLQLYLPDTDLNLGSVKSTLSVKVDQSTYDTITFERGDKVLLDEIRFGASYDDVTGVVPATDYENWDVLYSGADLADPGADFDGDGLTNDEERIWGLDPTKASSVNPYSGSLGAGGSLGYTRRTPMLTGLSYKVWVSTDLGSWLEDVTASQTPGPPDALDVETVEVVLTAMPAHGQLFVRIEAEE